MNEKYRELPTKKQSNKIFNTLTAWRFTAEDTDVPEFFIDNTEERLAKEIAYTLNHAITPYLGKPNLNEANLNKLLDFYEKTETFEVLSSFIFFSKKFDTAFDTLMKDIREGFYKEDLCTRQKNHPHPIFIGLGVKKLTNCRNTVLSLLKNTK